MLAAIFITFAALYFLGLGLNSWERGKNSGPELFGLVIGIIGFWGGLGTLIVGIVLAIFSVI